MTDQLIAELPVGRVAGHRSDVCDVVQGHYKRLADIANELGLLKRSSSMPLVVAGSDLRLTASPIGLTMASASGLKQTNVLSATAFEVQAEMARDLATSIFGASQSQGPAGPGLRAPAKSGGVRSAIRKARSILYSGKARTVPGGVRHLRARHHDRSGLCRRVAGLARCQLGLEVQGLEREQRRREGYRSARAPASFDTRRGAT